MYILQVKKKVFHRHSSQWLLYTITLLGILPEPLLTGVTSLMWQIKRYDMQTYGLSTHSRSLNPRTSAHSITRKARQQQHCNATIQHAEQCRHPDHRLLCAPWKMGLSHMCLQPSNLNSSPARSKGVKPLLIQRLQRGVAQISEQLSSAVKYLCKQETSLQGQCLRKEPSCLGVLLLLN